MKGHPFSFLFFLTFLAIANSQGYAQKQDSSQYYYNKILYPAQSSDIPNAIQYYTLNSDIYISKHKDYEAISALRLIAIGQFEIGNIYESENVAVKAISIIDNSPHSDTLIEARKGLYNQLGKIYRVLEQFDKAIAAYNLALHFSKTPADSLTIWNNKATIYKDYGNYPKAVEQLEIALQKKNINKHPEEWARILDNLGYLQSKLNTRNGLVNLKKALNIRDSLQDAMGIFSSNKHLALYYFDHDDKQLAQYFATKAYETANSINSLTYLHEALTLFAIIKDDPKIVQLQKISDSIARQKQLAQNKYSFLIYNVEKEKKKTAEAELAREKEKSQKIIYLFLVIAVILVAIVIYIYLRESHKKKQIMQVHKTEARISKKVHDEVANDVYQLMTKLQGNLSDKEKILDGLENIYNKTRDISKENSAIEIGTNFSEQLNDLLLTYQTDATAISTRNLSTLEWEIIPKIKKETVYRVLQELMTNMKKYSHASAVLLTFQQNGKNITIEYTDNGQGCTLKNKNGLQNAENRIEAIKGTIIFESEPGNGFRSKIRI